MEDIVFEEWPNRKFEDGVFTIWRKNFESTDTCGVTVEVTVNGLKNEITYRSVVF